MIAGPVYRYRAKVRRVIDGDTYILDVDLGFRIYAAINIRVHDYDAPEMVGPDRARGIAAKEAAEALLLSREIVIESYKDERSFERWVADVYVGGESIAAILTTEGHAK